MSTDSTSRRSFRMMTIIPSDLAGIPSDLAGIPSDLAGIPRETWRAASETSTMHQS